MEQKTKVHAEDGRHDITITREFDLPVELLFTAHTDAEIFEQWMSHEYGTTKVLKLEAKKHGSWGFQNSDMGGNVLVSAGGVFHDFVPNEKITRTFEMTDSPFGVQLEFREFEKLGDDRSRLVMHSVFRTVEMRDDLLRRPFAMGLSMAHDRLQEVLGRQK